MIEMLHVHLFVASRNLFAVIGETYNFRRVGCPTVDIIIIMTSKCNGYIDNWVQGKGV